MKTSKHQIYLGLTTTRGSNWREKIEEIKSLGLKEIALFPTALEPGERHELYQELAKTTIEYIPFVHLRHDSTQEEIDYFKDKYKTRLFNIHANLDSLENFTQSLDKELIYIENTDRLKKEFFTALADFAGLCLDIAHFEDYGILQHDNSYKDFDRVISNNKIGYCHASTVRDKPYFRHYEYFSSHDDHYSAHLMEKVEDFDYLKKYRDILPEIIALEIENPLKEQLKAKEYVEKIISNL